MSEHDLKVVSIRLVEEQTWYSKKVLTTPLEVVEMLCEKLSSYDRELFCVLNLSTKQQIINMNIVSMGMLNAALVHPRETFKSAILSNAAGIMLIHNHTSLICEPSKEDVQVTNRLEKCGHLLGIEVIDHIITGANHRFFSFREKGLLHSKERDDLVAQAQGRYYRSDALIQ